MGLLNVPYRRVTFITLWGVVYYYLSVHLKKSQNQKRKIRLWNKSENLFPKNKINIKHINYPSFDLFELSDFSISFCQYVMICQLLYLSLQ